MTGTVLIVALPLGAAFAAGFFCRSVLAGRILFWSSIAFAANFAVIGLLELDCYESKFLYFNCTMLSDRVAHAASLATLLGSVAYLFIGPVIVLTAGVIEAWARYQNRRSGE